ncbi:MAG: hypothetical protein Q4D27_04795 [Coriobacteriia bacterium]|nr:hypothetical protein [Coriobacteriia bacterium]
MPKAAPRNDKALVALAVALFVIATGLHIWWGTFPKTIDVMPDEMRYLDTARSLFSGDGLVLRGDPSTFQKILYPLAIMPALLFPDGPTQVQAINVLNSIYACSTVFPVLVLARRMFRKPAPIVGSMLAALMLPDLMYSMTFMTESLFIPITLWLVALCWRCFESSGNRELGLAAACGALCYAVYLCKEVAWMFVIAFVLWYIRALVRHRRSRSQAVMALGLFLIGFLGPFVIMKLTLFSGMLNSYSQFSFDILLSPYTVLFGLYSIATDATYFIVGFGVFPVLYLLCVYRDIPRRYRDLAFFCLVSLAIGLAVVVFTISMREDVGHVALRQHLRYVIPLFLPLLMLFVKQVAHGNPLRLLRNGRRRAFAAALTMSFCLLVVGFFGSANLSQGFDNSEFHFMRYTLEESEPLVQEYFDSWDGTMTAIDPDDGDLLEIDPVNWAWRLGVVAFTLVGMRFLFHRRDSMRVFSGALICGVIGMFLMANSVCAYHYNLKAYGVEEADIAEICAINEQLATRDEFGQVFVVIDDGNTKNNNLIDTYIQDGPGDYRYLTPDDLVAHVNARTDSEHFLPSDPVTFLLVNKKQQVNVVSRNAEQIGGTGNDDGRFILYHITGDKPLKVLVGD